MLKDIARNNHLDHYLNNREIHSVNNTYTCRISSDMDDHRQKRILIVDDDHSIRDILYELFTALKFEVNSVDNAYDALDLFINEGFDLVLSDIQMPGMDGWELAFNIKKTSSETPVILITGMDKAQVEEQMKQSYADAVLYKPFVINHLVSAVYSFLVDKG
jgi:CheY-like chemotaxis protein